MNDREGVTDQEISDFMCAPGMTPGKYALTVDVCWRVGPGGRALRPEAFGRIVDDETGDSVDA